MVLGDLRSFFLEAFLDVIWGVVLGGIVAGIVAGIVLVVWCWTNDKRVGHKKTISIYCTLIQVVV